MHITSYISKHVSELYEGNNWTEVTIAGTISDVAWQQAQEKTPASKNTIASLLHHLYYWNEIIMERMQGNDPFIPEANGYNVEEFKNETDWINLKDKTRISFLQLADAIKNFPEEKLDKAFAEGKSSYYKTLQGIVEHAYYHLGQMVILKKIINNKALL